MQPAPYSKTSDKELAAIHCLIKHLNHDRVKVHIRDGDKTPNHDGFLEILNEQHIPVGKMTVQIKSIPNGQIPFKCPMQLIAYSKSISEPFLLICVDCENDKVYWKHLNFNLVMFEKNRTTKKTFAISFSENDIIESNNSYINHWLSICNKYSNTVNHAINENQSHSSDYEELFRLNIITGVLMVKCDYCSKKYYIYPEDFFWKVIDYAELNQYQDYTYESCFEFTCECSRRDTIEIKSTVEAIDDCVFGFECKVSEKIYVNKLSICDKR